MKQVVHHHSGTFAPITAAQYKAMIYDRPTDSLICSVCVLFTCRLKNAAVRFNRAASVFLVLSRKNALQSPLTRLKLQKYLLTVVFICFCEKMAVMEDSLNPDLKPTSLLDAGWLISICFLTSSVQSDFFWPKYTNQCLDPIKGDSDSTYIKGLVALYAYWTMRPDVCSCYHNCPNVI